jgi:CelD/BcsL family acetyltransferase involved in cellulose biosynthesis
MSPAPTQQPSAALTHPPVEWPLPAVRVQPVQSLASIREPWTALAQQGESIFATWEFAITWWKHFGRGRPLRTVTWIDAADEVVAILPCYLWSRRPLRVVRFIGNGAGDVLGPICRPHDRPRILRAVRRLLDRPPWDWDVFVGENMPGDESWADELHGRVVRHEGNPVIRMTGDFDDYLGGRSANFRRQARARERRLRDRYAVRFRLCTDPDRLDDDLETAFLLHERRFGKRSAFTGRRTQFHREFARIALEQGWLRLWILELDGCRVAAFYGFRYGGIESFFQSGREPGLDRESLGMVMLTHAIRSAAADGIRTFSLLRGHEGYKYRFATEDHGLDTVCATRGRAAGAALGVLETIKSSSGVRTVLGRHLDI